MSRAGRRAALPDARWQPLERMVADSGGTAVRFWEENGRASKVFTFGQLPVDPAMQRWLARAFLNRTGARAGGEAADVGAVIVRGARHVRRCGGGVGDAGARAAGSDRGSYLGLPAAPCREEVGPGYLKALLSVLRDDTELSREVLVAMLTARQRGRGEREAPGGVTGYADAEMQLIMTALRRDVRIARDRIGAGHELLASYRSGPSRLSAEDQRAGRILDVFEATGDVPRYPGGAVLGLVTRAGGVAALASRLCLTLHEVTAFAVLLTALTGENFGTVAAWPAACHRPDGRRDAGGEGGGVALVEQVKPRRGPDREHMVKALEDLPAGLQDVLPADGDDRLFRSPLRLYLLLAELTGVSRRHGGHTCVFSAFTPFPGRHGGSPWVEGVGAHHLRRWARDRGFPAAGDAGAAGVPPVNVRRLRQTVIEQGRRPVSHTRRIMNGHYLMRSRAIGEDSRAVVGSALRDEVSKARAVQQVPVWPA